MNSLRLRLMLLFVALTTTTLALFAYYEQALLRRELESRFISTRNEIVEHLQQSLADPVWALNQEMMTARLEAALTHPEVASALLQAPDGGELYASVARLPTQLEVSEFGVEEIVTAAIYPPQEISPERRALPTALLRIHFDRAPLEQTLQQAYWREVIKVLAIDGLLLALLSIGLRMVFTPLARLRDALHHLAEHEDAASCEELAPFRLREFDRVIDGFNRTLRRLRQIVLQQSEAEARARAAMRATNEALAQVRLAQQELLEKNRLLEVLSITDQLTGLHNRHKLDQVLNAEFARCQRYEGVFSLVLVDIDHFKHINDAHGHPVGDRVLHEIAQRLQANKRAADTLGRWGGEEFLLICPDTSLEGVQQFSEKLRQAIADVDFSDLGCITASFGVSCFRPDDSLKDLISRCDQALYRSKNNGRNRVECLA